jgi:hypothetical protein
MSIQWYTETKELNWYEFKEWCENLREDGYNDWRMPTVAEILTSSDILDKKRYYWSATTYPVSTSLALNVSFASGYVVSFNEANAHSVRAVRTVKEIDNNTKGENNMKLEDGKMVSCFIEGHEVRKGALSYDEKIGKWYICQDIVDGSYCKDKKGFKYSWCISDGSDKYLKVHKVENLRPFDSTDIDDIYVGCFIITAGIEARKVLSISDEMVALSRPGGITFKNWLDKQMLKKLGYKIYIEPTPEPEPQIVELTIEDISNGKGVGVPAHLIRIKE